MANTTDMEKMFAALSQTEADEINGGRRISDIEAFSSSYLDKWKDDFIRGWNKYKG